MLFQNSNMNAQLKIVAESLNQQKSLSYMLKEGINKYERANFNCERMDAKPPQTSHDKCAILP